MKKRTSAMINSFDGSTCGQTATLRGYIQNIFNESGITAYYLEAGNKTNFPYITYSLRSIDSFDDAGESRRYIMEINAWTDKNDMEIENILDFLEGEFTGYTDVTDSFYISIDPAYGRIDLNERTIKRKRVSFELKYWYKECIN